MSTITFDTLSIAKRLKSKGLTEEQAEAIATELRHAKEYDSDHAATKADLREMEQRLQIYMGKMIGGGVVLLGLFMTVLTFFGHGH